ncbi:hypothetical protein [Fundidesulfovibrio putealis]|uniref:hypothetical protein n=1 Tax=Fundidesulfovibrio putealis TaxID=270496 RepID=UPI0003F7A3E7|nr:hypothetical protein [Fundidesulfovibrio putealis]
MQKRRILVHLKNGKAEFRRGYQLSEIVAVKIGADILELMVFGDADTTSDRPEVVALVKPPKSGDGGWQTFKAFPAGKVTERDIMALGDRVSDPGLKLIASTLGVMLGKALKAKAVEDYVSLFQGGNR